MKVLFIGDIVGRPGRDVIKTALPGLKEKHGLEFVIANAENSAGGSGITPSISEELFGYGVDVLTSGDHIWKKKEVVDIMARDNRVLRPANYPDGSPGSGFCVFRSNKSRIGVINIVGRVFMNTLLCPFNVSKKCVNEIKEKADIIIVDVHAEATSEKVALGWFLDGKVSAVIGTHTHIQTADEKILPKGTAYITDAGMTGPYDSVIGRRKECVLERFITQLPVKFEMAEGDVMLCGVVIDIDEKSGKARSIERVQHKGSA